jgi:hypothetical protein
MEIAAKDDTEQRPQDWSTVVRAAGYIYLGFTQRQAAKAAGCSERSIRLWKKCSWWRDAVDEFRDNELYKELEQVAVKRLMMAIGREGDTSTALKVLERLVPSMAPPAHRAELSTDQNIKVEGTIPMGHIPDNVLLGLVGVDVTQLRATPQDGDDSDD